jgi:hypothetical protein
MQFNDGRLSSLAVRNCNRLQKSDHVNVLFYSTNLSIFLQIRSVLRVGKRGPNDEWILYQY